MIDTKKDFVFERTHEVDSDYKPKSLLVTSYVKDSEEQTVVTVSKGMKADDVISWVLPIFTPGQVVLVTQDFVVKGSY